MGNGQKKKKKRGRELKEGEKEEMEEGAAVDLVDLVKWESRVFQQVCMLDDKAPPPHCVCHNFGFILTFVK